MALRILLITPQFYGIEKTIKSVLEDSGYEVVWLENKTLPLDYHGTKSKFKLLRKIYYFLFSPAYRYLKKELSNISSQKFDILFSINAHVICPYLFKILKNKNPDLFSVLYLWDSFSMYDWSREIQLFNKVYSFDPEDCVIYKIAYKPIFYIKNNNKKKIKHEADLFFVGKFSTERLKQLDKLLKPIYDSGLTCFVQLYPAYRILFHNYIIYSILRKLNIKSYQIMKYLLNFEAVEGILKKDYITQEKINYNEVQSRLMVSNVILDLPYHDQTGYTHRLIEALANGKKVITTNTQITRESFFNPDQIHLIDYVNPEMNISWIKERSEFSVDSFFSDLELSIWLNSMIDVRMA